MLRMPNPGSDISGIIRIFQSIYAALKNQSSFDLDDMTRVLISQNLATSSGYAGEAALALSTREDRSRDPLYNQSKAYTELYKLLGWLHPTPKSNLTFVFTYLGAHVANIADDDRDFVGECALGIVYPTDIIEVGGGYNIRPFSAILLTMAALDDLITRDEMIVGPLSLTNDRDTTAFQAMVGELKKLRGDTKALKQAMVQLGTARKISEVTMGNYTRFPIAFLQWIGWAVKVTRRDVYKGRSLPFLELTPNGKAIATRLTSSADIRKSDLANLPPAEKNALHRLGFYRMMEQAGFDIEQAKGQVTADQHTTASRLVVWTVPPNNLLYSPFQQWRGEQLQDAFPSAIMSGSVSNVKQQSTDGGALVAAPLPPLARLVTLSAGTGVPVADTYIQAMFDNAYKVAGEDFTATIDTLFTKYEKAGKTAFYPLIGKLFCCLGFDCEVSRHGVNAERWDAMIKDSAHSVPIEIKSPGEELYLSVKAIRQAVENKVVMTARKPHPSTPETTSLAVGYYPPNTRSEVLSLINDVHATYGIRVGVIDFRSLLCMVGAALLLGKIPNRQEIEQLHGIIELTNPLNP